LPTQHFICDSEKKKKQALIIYGEKSTPENAIW